jgi:mono/diheme cytochrome c family protein
MHTYRRHIATLFLLFASSLVFAQSAQDELVAQGKARYINDCAACHGADAQGSGPAAGELRTPPADLTQLARDNDGEFPTEYVQRVIDGRGLQTLAHGDIEMPVWGNQYRSSLNAYSERRIQQRIAALVAYLRTIQEM